MSATLGGLIKDFRLQKNIPQLEIAYKVGWKDASILSRIEQGITKAPSRAIVEKIILAMGLSLEEKNYLLFIGGYLPSYEEIEEIRARVKPIMNDWKYPMNVYDFSWRLIYENKAGEYLHYFDDQAATKDFLQPRRTIERLFDKTYLQYENLHGSKEGQDFLVWVVSQFIEEQKNRSGQKWYIELMKDMMKDQKFRTVYNNAQNLSRDNLVLDYAYEKTVHRTYPGTLSFHMFNVPTISDRRVSIEYLVPADFETLKYYETHEY